MKFCSPDNAYPQGPSMAAMLSCAVAVLLSISASFAIGDAEQATVHQAFLNATLDRASVICSALDHGVDATQDLAALFEASAQVTRTQFQIVASKQLHDNQKMKALAWIPRVPFASRHQYEQVARRRLP